MDELFTKWRLFSKVLAAEHFLEKQLDEVMIDTSVKPGVFFVPQSYKNSRFAIVVRYYSSSKKWNRIRKYIDDAGLNQDEFKFNKDVMIIIAYEQVQPIVVSKLAETLEAIYQTDEVKVKLADSDSHFNSGIKINFPPTLFSSIRFAKDLLGKLGWYASKSNKHDDGTFSMIFFPGYALTKEVFDMFKYDF